MHKDPFVVLGVGKDATQAEVKEAYERLRDEYRMAIHVEGEEGKKAAKKLSELEDAYREAMERLSANTAPATPMDDVMRELGITEEELDAAEDVVIE